MNFSKLLVISLACSFSLSSQCQASDISKLLQNFAGVVISFDDLDSKRIQIVSQIDKALSENKINASEAQNFKTELSDIEKTETQLKAAGKKLGITQSLIFTSQINSILGRLEQTISLHSTNNSTSTISPEVLTNQIDQQISASLLANKLTQIEADKIRAELKRIAAIQAAFIVSSAEAKLTDKQVELINTELNKIKASLDEQIRLSDSAIPQLNERRNLIEKKISENINSGKINLDLANSVRQDLQNIATMQGQFQLSDNSLNGPEILKIAEELDKTETKLDQIIKSMSLNLPPTDSNKVASMPPVAPQINNTTTSSGNLTAPIIPQSNLNKYSDISNYWGGPYIAILGEKGIIGGFPDGSYKPNESITRAQFAAIAMKALALPAANSLALFKDVSNKHWANSAIASVSASGLVTGFPDGTFRPEDKITRTQALVILAKALPSKDVDSSNLSKYTDAQSVPAWAYASVARAAQSGIIVSYPENNQIKPNDLATRGEVAGLMYQTLRNLGQNLPVCSLGTLPSINIAINQNSQSSSNDGTTPTTTNTNTSQTITQVPASKEKLYIYNISIDAPKQASGGDQITISAIGTPKCQARINVANLIQDLPITEIRPGVYQWSYTVRKQDNIGQAKVSVELQKDNAESVKAEANAPLSIDAKAPEVKSTQPLENAIVSDRLGSIVCTFSDDTGSGINQNTVKIFINGQDVTNQATINTNGNTGFLTYKPASAIKEDLVNIELRLTDNAGNSASQRWSYRFDKPLSTTAGGTL